jgi:acyl transferase domain-containing protein/aryl carrier-like protein
MLGVALAADEVSRRLPPTVELAAINGPEQCVVSGPTEAVERFAAELAAEGVRNRPLHTSHAFHSAMMEPAVEAFMERVSRVDLQAPSIPFQSNVTGRWIEAEEAVDPAYWGRHLRSTVRFSDNLQQLLEEPAAVLLEVGPGRNLTTFARYQRDTAGTPPPVVPSMRHPRQAGDDQEILLEALGRLWLHGVEIPWERLYAGEERRRLVLPTYPFQRRRYWIERREEGPAALVGAHPRGGGMGKRPRPADWLSVPSWRRLGTSPPPVVDASGEWLLVTGSAESLETEPVEELAAALRERGGTVTVVPSVTEVAELPPRIVLLGGMGEAPEGLYDELLAVGRQLSRQPAQPTTLWAVTAGVFEVSGSEALRPAATTALGPLRVLPQELPQVRCHVIDLEVGGDSRRSRHQVLGELASPHAGVAVAYRGAYRWAWETTALPGAEASPTVDSPTARLRRQGVYLLTGGFGNIGLALARTLVEGWDARVVLVGRTLPDPDAAEDPRTAVLRELGSAVEWVAADVTDEEALAAAVGRAEERFGGLHGVIHAAGVVSMEAFVSLVETDLEVTRRHFDPKVEGVRTLARVLERRQLDFVLLASSLSTVLGGLGMSAYAGANAYLNTFAARQSREGAVPWISVAWDGWFFADDTEDGAAAPELAMHPEEGCETFLRILNAEPAAEVIVSTADLGARLERWVTQSAEAEEQPPAELHPRPQLGTAYAAPGTPEEARLAAIWGELLGIEEVGIHDNFYDLGGDSILALRITGRAAEEGITLSVPDLYRHPTVAELAAALAAPEAPSEVPSEELAAAAPEPDAQPFELVDFDEDELSRISELVDHLDE